MLPSTPTGTPFKTLAIISLSFFKQEHFYHFQELPTYLVSFHPSWIIFFHFKKEKKALFFSCLLKLNVQLPCHWNDFQLCRRTCALHTKANSIQARGAKATGPEPWWPKRSDWASVVKTLVTFCENPGHLSLSQFMPVNKQTHDVHQAAAVTLLKGKQDRQPLALCFGSDNN